MTTIFEWHHLLFYGIGFVAVSVFVSLIYALLRFKRVGSQPNLKIELLWTLVPFAMLFLIALPIVQYVYHL